MNSGLNVSSTQKIALPEYNPMTLCVHLAYMLLFDLANPDFLVVHRFICTGRSKKFGHQSPHTYLSVAQQKSFCIFSVIFLWH